MSRALMLLHLHAILKRHHVSYGGGLRGNYCAVENNGEIHLGKQGVLESYPSQRPCKTGLFTEKSQSKIIIGDRFLLRGTMIRAVEKIVIGNDFMAGAETFITDSDFHTVSTNPVERRCVKPKTDPVIIGDNVWLGLRCLVLKGVHIGNNSVVAAGSVVVSDVPANEVWGGNPARFLKSIP
jgi:acetyltransferase-like isoleucine patch superfamily enzyme